MEHISLSMSLFQENPTHWCQMDHNCKCKQQARKPCNYMKRNETCAKLIIHCLNFGCNPASFLRRLAMGLQMVLRARAPNFTTGRIISRGTPIELQNIEVKETEEVGKK